MKEKVFRTVVGTGVLLLVLALTAGATVQAGSQLGQVSPLTSGAAVQAESRPNQALLPAQGGAVQGDYYWSPLGGPVVPGGQVYGLAVHPTIAGTLYAASWDGFTGAAAGTVRAFEPASARMMSKWCTVPSINSGSGIL